MQRAARTRWGAAGLVLPALLLTALTAQPAPRDTEARLQSLAADKAHRALLTDPLSRAGAALRRAKGMDQAGDTKHAALLRVVAGDWLDLAADLLRTAAAEAKAAAAEKDFADLETRLIRGRALLEETVARRGRAQAELDELLKQRESAGTPAPKAPAPQKPGSKPSDPSPAPSKPAAPPKKPEPAK